MKKILIVGYFVGMLFITYLVSKTVAVYGSDNVEVVFRDYSRKLNDTEIFQKHIVPKDNTTVVEKWKTKEMRTKTLFGWDTQIEYIESPQTYYVSDK